MQNALPPGFNLPGAPIAIDEIMVHKFWHQDEIVADRLIRAHGETKFPGVKTAKRKFIGGDFKFTEVQCDSKKILPLGIGNGCRFNDHVFNGKTIERIPGHCSATLVAECVGVRNDPRYVRFLDEVLLCDTTRDTRPWMLSEFIKVDSRRRNNIEDSKAVGIWANKGYDAVIEQEANWKPGKPDEKTLAYFYQKWREGREPIHDSRINKRLDSLVEESLEDIKKPFKDPTRRVTGWAHVVECMIRVHGDSPDALDTIQDHCQFNFESLVIDQMDFWREVKRPKKHESIGVPALINGVFRILSLMVIESEYRDSGRVGRYLGANIVLVRNPKTGNVAIFTDNDIIDLNLDDVMRMIRTVEMWRSKARLKAPWEDLADAGEIDEVSIWYFFRKAGQILNGSLTHDKNASKIRTSMLIFILRHGFHPEWLAYMRDPETVKCWEKHCHVVKRK